jgi:hypothetical protein
MPTLSREVFLPEETSLASLAAKLHAVFPDASLTLRFAGKGTVQITEQRARWVNDYALSTGRRGKPSQAQLFAERLLSIQGDARLVAAVRRLLLKQRHAAAVPPVRSRKRRTPKK